MPQYHSAEKKEDVQRPKPTIQILTQPTKMPSREITGHPRDSSGHSRDVTPHPRDVTPHPRDVTPHPRDVTPHMRDPAGHPREAVPHPRDPTAHPRDMTSHSRDSSTHSRDASGHSRDTTPHSRDVTGHSSKSVDPEKKHSKQSIPSSFGSYSQQQNIVYTTAKLTTTAPTICVKTVSKPTVSASSHTKPSSYLPYSTAKVSAQDMQMANLYTQQVLQHQLQMMQQQHQSSPLRTNIQVGYSMLFFLVIPIKLFL